MAAEYVQPKLFSSSREYYLWAGAVIIALIFMAIGHLFFPKVLTLLTYILIASITKYPKTKYSDEGDLIETTEFFGGYALMMIGWWYSVALLVVVNYLPFVLGYARIEEPFEAGIRVLRMIAGVGFLAILLRFTAYSPFNAMMIYLAFELGLWLFLAYGIMHLYTPTYALKAVVRWLLHYNILLIIGPAIGL